MGDLDDISQCSDREIENRITRLLQPGEIFGVGRDGTVWIAVVRIDEEGLESEIVWSNLGFDRRILLLDAFGWLWSRSHPDSSSVIWQRRQDLTRQDVFRRAVSARIPDPEDLDPEQVQAVYEDHHRSRK